MSARIFLSITSSGVARAIRHDPGEWSVEHSLAGQTVSCLAGDPFHPDVMYAGTQRSGVLRSADGGTSWQESGLAGQTVKALVVSHADPNVIFAGTRPALLFTSRESGASWEELDTFRKIPSRRFWFSPAEKPFTAYVQTIAPSPVDPDVLVVGIEAGATVRTEDGGKTWSGHRSGALRDCHSLTFHTTNGDYVYEAGGTGAGAAWSNDAGRTWFQPRNGLDRHYGWACAADPARPDIWYVSVAPGPRNAHGNGTAQAAVFRKTGSTWERLGGGLPQPLNHMPYSLRTDRVTPGALYAGLANGDVWHSTDYGETWEQMPFSLGEIRRDMVYL